MKNFIGSILIIVSIIMFGLLVVWQFEAGIKKDNELTGYWNMADRASTIEKKSEYFDKYVKAIEDLKLNEGYSTIVFNSYSSYMPNNYESIKSLQKRLHEIKKMDVSSFQYQTALQQITAQEWGEAEDLKLEFTCKYENTYFPYVLGWRVIFSYISLILLVGSGIGLCQDY